MSLGEHLKELQVRLKRSAIGFGLGTLVAYFFRKEILHWIRLPHTWATAKLNLAPSIYIFRYQDNFVVQLKICLMAGFVLAFPFILYQGLQFVSPGLYPIERKKMMTLYLPLFLILFLAGASFGYVFLIPYGLEFLLQFGAEVQLFPLIGFADYVSLFTLLVVMTGLSFELPLAMILLSRIGLIKPQTYRTYRRHAILTWVIVAAILTPPDPVTQIILAIPLILLYEIGVIFSRVLQPKPA